MFSPQGPSLRELCIQALSSVEHGYDLLAPKFDQTPFRTPESILDATTHALSGLGPFNQGLDVCCGTGAGMRVTADQPLSRLNVWSIRSVMAVEPYIDIVLLPGTTKRWVYTYRYKAPAR